jgi:hypothetical protein
MVAGALCLAGCGGNGAEHATPPPTLPRTLATALAARSDAVADALATGDSCRASTLAAELQRETIAAINNGRIVGALQEPVSASVNDLVARVKCVPPPQPPAKGHGRGKHKDHGEKGKEGD